MAVKLQQAGAVQTPETRAELEALIARRDELRTQLRASEERRFMLSVQAGRTDAEGGAAVKQRLASLDDRIADTERQLQQLDDAIARGMANPEVVQGGGVATPMIAAPAPPPAPLPPHEAMVVVQPHGPVIPLDGRTLLAGGLVSISLLALVGWLAFRYAVARMSRLVTGVNHINQLQQSVDAIAVEVERISENQRFVTKLLNQQVPGLAAAPGAEELERVSARLPREK